MAPEEARPLPESPELAGTSAPGPAGGLPGGSRSPRLHGRKLWYYFLLTYLAVMVNASRYLTAVHYDGVLTYFFVGTAYLTYCVVYALPVLLVAGLFDLLLHRGPLAWALGRTGRSRAVFVYSLAVLVASGVQVFLYVDVFLFRLWGYHLNSFVWNVLTVPGGIESMGGGSSMTVSLVSAVCALTAMQVLLLVLVLKVRVVGRILAAPFARRSRRIAAAGAFLAIVLFQAGTYGACKLRWYTPVLEAAGAFPLYMPLTFSKLGRRMGWERDHPDVELHVRYQALNYPRHPITLSPDAPVPNIVWLVCESWRADMVDPKIMPQTHAFATKQALWFDGHYSGGSGTRMGMFSLFYGLHGSYWFPMLRANHPPVLMDVLRRKGYQFDCRTSQAFTYPEFDNTIFAGVPADRLHPISNAGRSWQRDRKNVTNMLEWIDHRDQARPFFQFMFFESAHAPYTFPPENEIRKTYLKDFNYAKLDEIGRDPVRRQLVKNRYLNSCNHLDGQIHRVLDHLRLRGLLDTTLVVLTGDHGEEFWDAGRWGHPAGSYHEGHQRVPLILHLPGHAPRRVTRMTSHLDVAPTVLRLLGVTNPPEDYCLGYDLLGDHRRDSVCIFGWNEMGYVDQEWKIGQQYRGPGLTPARVTTRDDRPASPEETARVLQSRLPRMMRTLQEMRRFAK